MTVQPGGFLHWRKERYLIDDAIALWNGRALSVYGKSGECSLHFCGVPFGLAASLAEIKGRKYYGERETPFSEGRLVVADQPLYMNDGEINCIGVGASQDSVVLEFAINVEDERGRSRKLTGGIRCRVVKELEHNFRDIGN